MWTKVLVQCLCRFDPQQPGDLRGDLCGDRFGVAGGDYSADSIQKKKENGCGGCRKIELI